MKSQNTKSSDELKREVHQEIRNVRRDIDEMTGNLSPGRVIDRAIFARHGNSIRASLDHLKNNPIGATFLSIGTLLLMEDEYNETYETRLRNRVVDAYGLARLHKDEVTDRVGEVTGDIRAKAQDLKSTVQTKVSGVTDQIRDKVESFRGTEEIGSSGVSTDTSDLHGVHARVSDFKERASDLKDEAQSRIENIESRVSGKIDDLENKFSNMKDRVQDKISSAKSSASDYENWVSSETEPRMQKVKDKIGNVKERLSDSFDTGRDKLSSAIDSSRDRISNMDPVSYMALGAGLGVLTGAALPVTEAERSFVQDKLDDRLATFDTDIKEAINECSNILKDLVVQDAKDFSVKFF